MLRVFLPGFLLLWVLAPRAFAGGEGAPAYTRLYGELLIQYTRSVNAEVGTRVDYRGLKAEPRWKQMVVELSSADPSRLRSRNEALAFWINAYNILAIDLVIRHYPVESIREIGSFFRSVWKREAGQIGGRDYSLDEIEHAILRPMKDSRIHGAIVCASISCPSLARTPYRTEELDAQLEASIRSWLSRPEKGLALDRDGRRIAISRVFKWFSGDFGGHKGVLEFVRRHAPAADAAWLESNLAELRLSYLDYDWNLNDWPRRD